MVNKYRIVKLAKPYHHISRYRFKIQVYNYSVQKQKHFLWFSWWKIVNYYKTFDEAKKAILKLKQGDAINWKDTVVWSE